MSSAAPRVNPFPGLRSFEPDEDYLFFGRERQVDELLRRLRTHRFLAVVGTSGSGKSSLVRSGLIPSLHGGAMVRAGSSWRVAILRPGADPLGNLAAALHAPGVLAAEERDDELGLGFAETTLRASNQGLVDCVRQARLAEGDNVLVVVDQFEELFRFKRGAEDKGRNEAAAFVKLLLAAAGCTDVPIYVALTLRSDYIGNCMEFPDLPEVINQGLYLVPRLTRDELRSAIASPVAVGGGTIAPRLVLRLLNDVGEDPDQLPILQHALLRTWERWQEDHAPGEPLDLRHYEAIGTMATALSRHAEEAYGELDPRGQALAGTLWKALTDRGTYSRGIRRPAPLSEICALTGATEAEVAAVVERFRQPGRSFLMPPAGTPLHGGTILDLSHESLMRIWDRLARWVEDEARSAQLYLGTAHAAARHAEGTAALWRDPELQIALTWREREKPTALWARRYEPGFDRAMLFLDASRKEREASQRREVRRTRLLIAILAAATLLSWGFGAYARRQQVEANRQRKQAQHERDRATQETAAADRARNEAVRSAENARALQDQADRNKQVAETEKTRAEQAERKEKKAKAEAEGQRDLAQSEAKKALAETQAALVEQGKAETARHEAEESSKQEKLSAAETLRLSHISAARALALKPEQDAVLGALLAVTAYRIYHQDRLLTETDESPEINASLRQALARLQGEEPLSRLAEAVRALALHPDGTLLAAGSEDGDVYLFDPHHLKAERKVLKGFGSGVRALAFDGTGRLAAGSAGGSLRLWEHATSGSSSRDFPGSGGGITALSFQPGGALLAIATANRGVELLDVRHPESGRMLLFHPQDRPTGLAWSRDGRRLAAGLAHGGALRWQSDHWTGRADAAGTPSLFCDAYSPQDGVLGLAFDPRTGGLSCGTARGEIRLANTAPPIPSIGGSVNALSYSGDGLLLASAWADGAVRLWAPDRSGDPPLLLQGHKGWVWAVAADHNGHRVFSAGEDRTVRSWIVRSADLAAEICRRMDPKAPLTPVDRWWNLPSDLQDQDPCPASP